MSGQRVGSSTRGYKGERGDLDLIKGRGKKNDTAPLWPVYISKNKKKGKRKRKRKSADLLGDSGGRKKPERAVNQPAEQNEETLHQTEKRRETKAGLRPGRKKLGSGLFQMGAI